ncbi:MAG: acyl-CoA thioesterase [Acidobacteria bacterium]|nr:acyl-CoA thioesterase [Acidobacteriota bacterium]
MTFITPSSFIPHPSSLPFTTRVRVRFGDADPAGLVYYPIIFHYFHIALEEFFAERCGITYAKLMTDERIGFPTVNTQTDFLIPLVYGDETDVQMRVMKLGRASITFEYEARRANDGALCARSAQVHVCMNLDTRRAVPIPDKYREIFEKH